MGWFLSDQEKFFFLVLAIGITNSFTLNKHWCDRIFLASPFRYRQFGVDIFKYV